MTGPCAPTRQPRGAALPQVSRRLVRSASALLVAALLGGLGGCAHTLVVGADRTLHIALSEYRLRPDQVRASSGALTIYVHNYGRLTHNLVVSEGPQQIASTKPLWPGQSAELAISLAPGTYSLVSSMLSDEALGAFGTLKVTR